MAITRDGVLVDAVSVQRRRLAFLAVLGCAGFDAPVSRDRLLLLFWPERDEALARSALKQLTFAIRRHLAADELFLGATELRLNPAVITSDVGDLLEAASRKAHASVVELYAGPFLDGIHLSDTPEFDRWAESQRTRLAQIYRGARGALAAAAESRGAWPEAVTHWRALAADDPLDALTARRLVSALAATGDVAGAIRHARGFETLLRDEAGVGLDEEFRALIGRLHEPRKSVTAVVATPHVEVSAIPTPAAREILKERAESGVPRPATGRPSLFVRRLIAVAAALLVIGIGAALARRRPAAAEERSDNTRLVAVVPFDLDASDSSLTFLRDGMPDLIDAAIAGSPGVRIADQHAVVSAMRDAHLVDGRNPSAVARVLGDRLSAAEVVTGTIVGTSQNFVVSLRTVDVARDSEAPAVKVAGSIETLAKLADRLAISVLASTAARDEPHLSDLTGRSFPVLRAYLAARAAYRQGRLQDAIEGYRTALRLDSTFALAAMGIAAAGGWTGTSLQVRDSKDFQLGWKLRDRLSRADQALFDAYVGPRDPSTQRDAERLAAWEHAYNLFPDRAEVAYEYGDRLFHVGGYLGIAEADERAARAFAHAVALDSGLYLPLGHLVELAARRGDAVTATHLLQLYQARDSSADAAEFLRWQVAIRTGDSAGARLMRQRIPTMPVTSLKRLVSLAQYDAIGADDADRALRVLLSRQLSPNELAGNLHRAHSLAMNRGRVREAEGYLRELRTLAANDGYWAVYFGDPQQLQIFDALFSVGDTLAAAKIVEDAERGSTAERGRNQYPWTAPADACTLELWRLSRGNTLRTTESLERLRQSATGPDSASYYGWNPELCIAMIDASRSQVTGTSDAEARLLHLDTLMMVGPHEFGSRVGNLLLAKLFAARGDFRHALQVIRRRWRDLDDGPAYSADAAALEATFAAKVGDAEASRAALLRYRSLRGSAPGAAR